MLKGKEGEDRVQYVHGVRALQKFGCKEDVSLEELFIVSWCIFLVGCFFLGLKKILEMDE